MTNATVERREAALREKQEGPQTGRIGGRIGDDLMGRRREAIEQARQIAGRAVAFDRDLTESEAREFDRLLGEADKLEERAQAIEGEARAHELEDSFFKATGRRLDGPDGGPGGVPSLAPSREDLESLLEAVRGSGSGRVEVRSTVALASVGGWVARDSGGVPEPRRLMVALRMQPVEVGMRGLAGAKFGTETAAAPTSEGNTKPEYDAVSQLTIVPQAFARWTDITRQAVEALEIEGLRDMEAAHSRQIALDEDAYIQGVLETEAGSPVAYAADVTGNVLTQMAHIEATLGHAADVILVNPADYAKLANSAPANAEDLGSSFSTFNGALLYPTAHQDAGVVLVAALRTVGRYVKLAKTGLELTSKEDLKTNVVTCRSEMFTGFGIAVGGGVRAVTVTSGG